MRKKSSLKRRTLIRKVNNPVEVLEPERSERSFATTKDYRDFWGHVVKEIAQKLPKTAVVCWKDDHILSLPVCAMNKFIKEKKYCKRCSLFQGDVYSKKLYELIENWEKDEMEDLDGS